MRLRLNNNLGSIVEVDFPETTMEQVRILLAARTDSLPKWTLITDYKLEDKGYVIYRDLVAELKGLAIGNFVKLLCDEKKFKPFGLESPEVVKAWFYINSKTPTPVTMSQLKACFDSQVKDLKESVITAALSDFKQQVQDNKASAKELKTELDKVEKVSLTAFETTGENLVLKVTDTRNILEVLDNMKVSEQIPFATAKVFVTNGFLELMRMQNGARNEHNYYKMYLPSHYFSDTWLDTTNILPNTLRFYIDNTSGHKKEYAVGIWDFTTGTIHISFTLVGILKNRDILLRVLRETFGLSNLVVEKSTAKGFVIIPKIHVNIPIFLDFLCTNVTMRQFFHMDENAKTSLDKVYFNIYYHASEKEDDMIDFTMTHMIANEGQFGLKSGDPYVYLSVKDARDENVVKDFIRNMSILMSMYKNKYESIKKIYVEYIGEEIEEHKFKVVGRKKKNDTSNLNKLKAALPNVFDNPVVKSGELNYAVLCQKRQPHYIDLPISEETSNKLQATYPRWNKQVLEFPKNSGFGFYCPADTSPKHNIPGLRELKGKKDKVLREIDFIDNSGRIIEKVKYLPCCFTSQKKADENIKEYLGQTDKVGTISTGAIKSKSNFLNTGQIGEAPDQIVKLLESCNYKNIKRLGISVSHPDMILLAIAKGLGINKTESELRDEILKPQMIEAGIQELSKIGVNGAKKMVKDEAAYLSARQFYHTCEIAFRCNLVILEESELNSNEFVFMRPDQGVTYIAPPSRVDWPTLVMWLRTRDDAEVLELIIRQEDKKKYETKFNNAEPLLQLRALGTTYTFVESTPTYEESPHKLVGQVIDSLGKRRGLIYNNDKITYTVYTGISYPLPLPIYPPTICNVSDLIRAGLQDHFQKTLTYHKEPVGILTSFGEIPATFDVKIALPTQSVSKYYLQTSQDKSPETIIKTLTNYKIASYLMQNVLNLYSDLGMNFKDLDDSLTVDTDFEYTLDLFGKSVSEARDTDLWRNNTIICNSEALKGRMMNWAEQLYRLVPELVTNFKLQDTYLDLYQSARDFNNTDTHRVFDSSEEVKAHFRQHTYRVWLKGEVPVTIQKPYYVYDAKEQQLELVK